MAGSACFWPGCNKEAFCVSGNVDAPVCQSHFEAINGDTDAGLLMVLHQIMVMRHGYGVTEPMMIRLRGIADSLTTQ